MKLHSLVPGCMGSIRSRAGRGGKAARVVPEFASITPTAGQAVDHSPSAAEARGWAAEVKKAGGHLGGGLTESDEVTRLKREVGSAGESPMLPSGSHMAESATTGSIPAEGLDPDSSSVRAAEEAAVDEKAGRGGGAARPTRAVEAEQVRSEDGPPVKSPKTVSFCKLVLSMLGKGPVSTNDSARGTEAEVGRVIRVEPRPATWTLSMDTSMDFTGLLDDEEEEHGAKPH